jgi:hypothetical protein
MKLALVTLLAVVGSQSFADAKQFVGRYRPDPTNCRGGLGEFPRVYVKIENDPWGPKGTKSVSFQSYGDDARGFHVLLGSGKRQAPGTSKEIHGEVTQSWKTKIVGNQLESLETTSRPSIKFTSWSRTTLTANPKWIWFRREVRSQGEEASRLSCKLVRY